jgi:hypothetical protein
MDDMGDMASAMDDAAADMPPPDEGPHEHEPGEEPGEEPGGDMGGPPADGGSDDVDIA